MNLCSLLIFIAHFLISFPATASRPRRAWDADDFYPSPASSTTPCVSIPSTTIFTDPCTTYSTLPIPESYPISPNSPVTYQTISSSQSSYSLSTTVKTHSTYVKQSPTSEPSVLYASYTGNPFVIPAGTLDPHSAPESPPLPPSAILIRNWCEFQLGLFAYDSNSMNGQFPIDRAVNSEEATKIMKPNSAFWQPLKAQWAPAEGDDPSAIRHLTFHSRNVLTLVFRQFQEDAGGNPPQAHQAHSAARGSPTPEELERRDIARAALPPRPRGMLLSDGRSHSYGMHGEFSDKYGYATAGVLPLRHDKERFYSSQRPAPEQLHPNWTPFPTADGDKWRGLSEGAPERLESPGDSIEAHDERDQASAQHHTAEKLEKRNPSADIIMMSYVLLRNRVFFNLRRAERCWGCKDPNHGPWWNATVSPRFARGRLFETKTSNWIPPLPKNAKETSTAPTEEESRGHVLEAGKMYPLPAWAPQQPTHGSPSDQENHPAHESHPDHGAPSDHQSHPDHEKLPDHLIFEEPEVGERSIVSGLDGGDFDPKIGQGYWYPSEASEYSPCRKQGVRSPGPDLNGMDGFGSQGDWRGDRIVKRKGYRSVDSNCLAKAQLVVDLCPPRGPNGK